MCGINGIFAHGESAPPVDEAELLRTREAMMKRGPDGAGLWISPGRDLGLAHRRLSIIDLSGAAAQPMASADGRWTITYNGELYNYRDLRRELEAKGRAFRTGSDTEVLLGLYADRGPEMLTALRGMFALAIWDERDKILFLARDRFGIKPLYYADEDGTFRFASQVKALVAGGGVRATRDLAGWAGFFIWGAVPEPLTTYQQVRSLPAGCWMKVTHAGGMLVREYFSVSATVRNAELAGASASPSLQEVRQVLEESVRYHLVADVPVGMFLSAGIDSSLIARIAARHRPDLRTITLGFEEFRGGALDETVAAEALASELQSRHSTRWISAREFDSVRDAFLGAMDQPTIDGLNTWLVSRVAAEAGMKVALSGLGGDEFFGGYPSFRQVPRVASALAWSARVPRVGRIFRQATAAAFAYGGAPKYAGVLEYGATIAGAYLLRRAVYMPWELPGIMGPEAASEGLRGLAAATPENAGAAPISDWAKICVLETTSYMRNMLLRDADWAGMAHGVEIRVPLVDPGVFHLAAKHFSAHRPLTKSDLRRAAADAGATLGEVPRKRGFVVPMRSWLTGTGGNRHGGKGSRLWAVNIARTLAGNPLQKQVA